MRNKIASAFFLLLAGFNFSQIKVYTCIQENSKTYPGKNFMVSKVIDSRKEKGNIGTVHKSDLDAVYLADLKKPLPEEFITFLNRTFPKGSTSNQVILVINDFEIGDVIKGTKKDTGFVKVNFDFYSLNHDSAFFLYNYVNTLKDAGDNIPLTHSNRMKRVILLSVAKLDSLSYIQRSGRLLPDSLNNAESYTSRNFTKNDSTIKANNYPSKRMTLIMAHGIFGSVADMYGANVSFMGQLEKHPRYLLGFNLNYSIIAFKDVTIPNNTSYKIFTTDFGFRLLKQIKNFTFFNSVTHIMIGKETYTTLKSQTMQYPGNGYATVYQPTETTQLFTGVQFDNGLLFTHPTNKGVAAGVDFVLRMTNSSVFDSDFGIKLTLGVAF